MREVTIDERRARLGRRHHLAAEAAASDVTTLAGRLVGLHATDPGTVFLSARARVPGFRPAAAEKALYETRSLQKHLCMRRTLFVLPTDDIPIVQAACTNAIAARERVRVAREVERGGVTKDGTRWLRKTLASTLAAIEEIGPATGAQISQAVPLLNAKLRYGEGKAWGGEVGVATWILTILAAEGAIVRDRPDRWNSSRHRWRIASDRGTHADERGACAALVERWLRAFGPATIDDIVWWTGLGVGRIRPALATLDIVDVRMDGTAGVALADDLGEEPAVEPWAALLPALDPTTMGWKRRDWYLGDHGDALFDRNGNAGPTVWWDGRIVGGWAQRKSGEVVYELLEDTGRDAAVAIEAQAADLQEWLGDVVVTPRFPTPLAKRLAG